MADLRDMFDRNEVDRLSSADIIEALGKMEERPVARVAQREADYDPATRCSPKAVRYQTELCRNWPQGLPAGMVHGNLFPLLRFSIRNKRNIRV